MTYSARYDQEPCAAAKDAAIRAQEEGAHVGQLLLAAGLNPYLDNNLRLADIWEHARRDATLKRMGHAR